MGHRRIGDVLKEYGYITDEQLTDGLRYQKDSGTDKRIGEILVDLGFLTEEQRLAALAGYAGIELIDLPSFFIDDFAVEKIPRQMAAKYVVLAIAMDGSRLTVAMEDPLNLYAIEDIRLVTDMQVNIVLARKQDILKEIEICYSEMDARTAADRANEDANFSGGALDQLMAGVDDAQAPIVRLLNSLLRKGYNTNVSDIHIEPYERETVIRMRRDGMLLPYMTLSPALHHGLVARTKILAQMDIAEKRKPQDGHFKMELDGNELNVRISFVPTLYGEKGVLRFLTSNAVIDNAATFGMSSGNYVKVMEMLKNPHGIIYLTGPTGSGKTTTLYSILQFLSSKPVNIATIEDPIERSIPKLNQMQVNEPAGVTFETGLRAILRQDPDVIMVGETRDYVTAAIAARAAITGHIVFSTLHTNDSISSVIRLRDMGLKSYMVASSVVGIVAQRLLRKLCSRCKEEYSASKEEMEILFEGREKPSSPVRIYRKRGCHICANTGYSGRIAIHEVLNVDSALRRMITGERPMDEMRDYAVGQHHMSTLRREAAKLVLEGITGVEEMQRVTYHLD